LAFLQKLERYNLQAVLDSIRDFPRMWSGNFRDRVRLSNDKKIPDFPQEVFGFTLDSISA